MDQTQISRCPKDAYNQGKDHTLLIQNTIYKAKNTHVHY